jgi:hypothetical protein
MSLYWRNGNADHMGHAYWFGVRMSQYMFDEMFRCINPDIDVWMTTVNEQCYKNKIPIREIGFDESMDPTKSRFNPNHVFIKLLQMLIPTILHLICTREQSMTCRILY